MIDHKELRRLALSATPGPWVVPEYSPDEIKTSDDFDGQRIVCSDVTGCPGVQNEKDAHYIAALSPSVVLALLDEVEAMRKDAERYRWIKSRDWSAIEEVWWFDERDLDSGIDAAMQAKEEQ